MYIIRRYLEYRFVLKRFRVVILDKTIYLFRKDEDSCKFKTIFVSIPCIKESKKREAFDV